MKLWYSISLQEMRQRFRFAPSPTGPLHIGGARTALFNFLMAKQTNGVFILRIEDTDKGRLVEKSEGYIEAALDWLGLSPDEGPKTGGEFGPYRQSDRLDIYRKKIKELIRAKKAYYAFDTKTALSELREKEERRGSKFKYGYLNRLELDNSLKLNEKEIVNRIKKEPYVIRLKIEKGVTETKDVLRGNISINNEVLDDKILLKADGYPTYHFANVVDDHLMKISTVIRGEEWLPSLAIHKLIYDAFNWKTPDFLHLPLILKPEGKGKLSKRDADKGDFPVFPLRWGENLGYKELGFLNVGLVNYLALLGWNPGIEKEVFSLKELIEKFSFVGIQKGGAKFDYTKAKWINQKHLSVMTYGGFDLTYPNKAIKLKKHYPEHHNEIYNEIRNRITLLNDLDNELKPFLENPNTYDNKFLKKQEKNHNLLEVLSEIETSIRKGGLNNLKENLYEISKSKKIKFSLIMQLLRLSFVGNMSGPDLFFMAKVLTKTISLKRVLALSYYIKKNNSL